MSKVLISVNPMLKTESACIIRLGVDRPLEKFQGSCKCRPDIHVKCIDTWFTKNGKTCPICRQKYPENEDQKKKNEENRLRADSQQESCAVCVFCCYIFCVPLVQLMG
jgi:hypothetical protein